MPKIGIKDVDDRDIIKIAKYYIYTKNVTLKKTAEKFDISLSALNKYLNDELKVISPRLYGKVQGKKAANLKKNRFSKYKFNFFDIFKKSK